MKCFKINAAVKYSTTWDAVVTVLRCVYSLTSQTQVSGCAVVCILADRDPAAAAEYPSADRRPATVADGDEVGPRRKWRWTTAAAAAAAAATAAASPGPETADGGVSRSTTSCLIDTDVGMVDSELLAVLLVAIVRLLLLYAEISTPYHHHHHHHSHYHQSLSLIHI